MDVEEETREEKFWREFWADLPVKNQSRPLLVSVAASRAAKDLATRCREL